MALINKKNNEYLKLNLDDCFINKNGIYCGAIIFLNQDERAKDKLRSDNILKFEEHLKTFQLQLINDIGFPENIYNIINSDKFSDKQKEKFSKLSDEEKVAFFDISKLSDENKKKVTVYLEGISILDKLSKERYLYVFPNSKDQSNFIPAITDIDTMKQLGYLDTFFDKVKLKRTDIIYVCPYDKQDFTLESFYQLYKNNCYLDKTTGSPLLEDA